jgi:hypothetical protein
MEDYVRHASKYGGAAVVWETASAHLPAELLPQLAAELSAIAKRRREPFRVPRSSSSAQPADSSRASRNETSGQGDTSSSGSAAPQSRLCASPWCRKQLPASLRADARYCPGGRCRQAAYRARAARGET